MFKGRKRKVMEMVKIIKEKKEKNIWDPSSILILIIKKDKENGSKFQFTSCERVTETCKIKRTKIFCQRTGIISAKLIKLQTKKRINPATFVNIL